MNGNISEIHAKPPYYLKQYYNSMYMWNSKKGSLSEQGNMIVIFLTLLSNLLRGSHLQICTQANDLHLHKTPI